MQQATVPLSRLNITLYSVERRAINNVEKCAYSRALNRLFLSNSVLICHGIGRARLLRFLSKEGERSSSPPADRYATIRRRCICIGRVFRARSVKSIDLEPCLKFTWVMSMKLERILIARLECSSSVYFCTGGMAKLLLFVIRLCKYCAQISYREIYRLFVGRRIELISGNFVQIDGRANIRFLETECRTDVRKNDKNRWYDS